MNDPIGSKSGGTDDGFPAEWFRALLDKLPAVAFIKDADGRFVYVNEKMRRDAHQAACGDLLGKRSHDYLQPEVVGMVLDQDRRVLTQNEPIESLDTLPLRDGTVGQWLVCKFPLRDSSNRPYVAGIAIDVTARRRAAAAIEQSEERLRAVFAHAAIGICVSTLEGNVQHVNPALCTITGRSAEELLGSNLFNLTHPEDGPRHRELAARLLAGQIPSFVMEKRYLARDGRPIWVRNSVSLARDDRAQPTAFVALVEDIAQRKRAEELERERLGLKESVSAMEKVLGVVAHELRTPLASVRAMAELLLLQESAAGQEAEQFLQRVHDEAVRMTETVDSLLEAARLNSGHAKWNWASVPLEAICRLAADSIRPLLADGVALTVKVEPAGARMLGDADAVRRLLINLLGNARKHTSEGHIEVSALLLQQDGHPRVRLQVSDTGRGIPPELLGKLGEAFALNSGVVGADHVSGTGLGLAICKGIVEAHGGRMDIESAPGRGTRVTVLLRADLPEAVRSPKAPPVPPPCSAI